MKRTREYWKLIEASAWVALGCGLLSGALMTVEWSAKPDRFAPEPLLSAVAISSLLVMVPLLARSLAAMTPPTRDLEQPIDMRLQESLNEVKSSMGKASQLMHDLQREMDAQTAARDALIAQASEHKRLAEIDQEQAEKIRGILLDETKAEAGRQKRVQLLYFVGGVLLSVPIGVAINILTNRL